MGDLDLVKETEGVLDTSREREGDLVCESDVVLVTDRVRLIDTVFVAMPVRSVRDVVGEGDFVCAATCGRGRVARQQSSSG